MTHEYGLYDIKDNEVCLGIYTTKELAKYFNTSCDCIRCCVSRRQTMRKRYKIEKVEVEE